MATKTEVTQGMQLANERAASLTRLQIHEALKINAEYFDGEGLTYVPAILQALATNYSGTLNHMGK